TLEINWSSSNVVALANQFGFGLAKRVFGKGNGSGYTSHGIVFNVLNPVEKIFLIFGTKRGLEICKDHQTGNWKMESIDMRSGTGACVFLGTLRFETLEVEKNLLGIGNDRRNAELYGDLHALAADNYLQATNEVIRRVRKFPNATFQEHTNHPSNDVTKAWDDLKTISYYQIIIRYKVFWFALPEWQNEIEEEGPEKSKEKRDRVQYGGRQRLVLTGTILLLRSLCGAERLF
ncbi:hypothetical protein EV359DRAFT_66353, partial [Lentinula novae-zelandiae]